MLKMLRFSLVLAGTVSAVALAQTDSTGRQRVENLVGKLENPEAGEQFQAVSDLADLGPLAKPAVPALVKTLKSGDDLALKHEILIALGRIGSPAAEAVPAIAGFLNNSSPVLQYEAVHALRKIGPDAKSALPQLAGLLKSDKPVVQVSAAWAVVAIGNKPEDRQAALPVLMSGLASQDLSVVSDAEMGLASVGKDAIPGLVSRVKGDDPHVAGHAADALGMMGPEGEAGIPAFVSALDNSNPAVVSHAAQALGNISAASENRGACARQETQPRLERSANRRRLGFGRIWNRGQRRRPAVGRRALG